jgi:hypothetical protein
MRYLIIFCMLFANCSIFRKSVNTVKQEMSKSTLTKKDSTGHTVIDSTRLKIIAGWKNITVDSGYDKVTEEVIKEVIDSGGIRRKTTRTIKEKGQKRTEQSSNVVKYDSGAAMITEHSQLQEIQREDSSGAAVTIQKDVKRSSFMPWWIWLIAAIPVAVCLYIWKRNSILKLFT